MRERSEWETVFERFPSGPLPIVGPIEVLVHDWSKPADLHPRLFTQGALEWQFGVSSPLWDYVFRTGR